MTLDKSSAHDTASQYFIHRDFRAVLEVLGRRGPNDTSIKTWILYLALCDRAFIEPDRPDWPINDAGRKALRQFILQSEIWQEMQHIWESENELVPHSLIHAGIKLAAKHKGDPQPIVDFVEKYLIQNTLPPAVLEAFIIDVVVNLQHDFFYAREIVNAQFIHDSDTNTHRLLDIIDTAETNHKELLSQELKDQEEFEKRRLEAAIANDNEPSDQEDQRDLATTTSESNNDGPQSGDSKAVVPRPFRTPPRKQRSLTEFWKEWFHQFIRSQGLYNAIIFVFLVVGLVSNMRARLLLRRGTKWLWTLFKSGIKMGLSVSYL